MWGTGPGCGPHGWQQWEHHGWLLLEARDGRPPGGRALPELAPGPELPGSARGRLHHQRPTHARKFIQYTVPEKHFIHTTDLFTPSDNEIEVFYRPQTKLQKGNIFTPVCQSFCWQEEVSVWCHFLSSPCSFWGGNSVSGPCSFQGVFIQGGVPLYDKERAVRILWNAFFSLVFFAFAFASCEWTSSDCDCGNDMFATQFHDYADIKHWVSIDLNYAER